MAHAELVGRPKSNAELRRPKSCGSTRKQNGDESKRRPGDKAKRRDPKSRRQKSQGVALRTIEDLLRVKAAVEDEPVDSATEREVVVEEGVRGVDPR